MLRIQLMGLTVLAIVPTLGALQQEKHTAYLWPKGEGYCAASYCYYRTNRFWNSSGGEREAHHYVATKQGTFLSQYSITSSDMLFADISYLDASRSHSSPWAIAAEAGIKHALRLFTCQQLSSQLTAFVAAPSGRQAHARRADSCNWGGAIDLMLSGQTTILDSSSSYDLNIGYGYAPRLHYQKVRLYGGINVAPWCHFAFTTALQWEISPQYRNHKHNGKRVYFIPAYELLKGILELNYYPCNTPYQLYSGFEWHLTGRNAGIGGTLYGGVAWRI
jgi:hypothetical protein